MQLADYEIFCKDWDNAKKRWSSTVHLSVFLTPSDFYTSVTS